MPLRDVDCRSAKPRSTPYKKTDGGGLYLEILPTNAKSWRWKYRFDGKEKRITFGLYPTISIADARAKHADGRKLLAQGIDPSAHKQETKRQRRVAVSNTFEVTARSWHDHHKEKWDAKHSANVLARLKNDLIPSLGSMPIQDIKPSDVMDAIKKIEKRGAYETARRSLQYARQVFSYAVAEGKLHHNPASDLRCLLRSYKKGHFRAIEFKELGSFLQALERNEARLFERTRIATKLLMHTFVRTSELIKATWDEIDLDKGVWKIPAHRMKMKNPHTVPLSHQVVTLLRQAKELGGDATYVLPGQNHADKHMSEATILGAIKRLGYGDRMTGHGFRALAMTTIKEQLHYPHDVVDRQLSHGPKNRVDAAYDRTVYADQRKKMMQDWSDLIDQSLVAASIETMAAE